MIKTLPIIYRDPRVCTSPPRRLIPRAVSTVGPASAARAGKTSPSPRREQNSTYYIGPLRECVSHTASNSEQGSGGTFNRTTVRGASIRRLCIPYPVRKIGVRRRPIRNHGGKVWKGQNNKHNTNRNIQETLDTLSLIPKLKSAPNRHQTLLSTRFEPFTICIICPISSQISVTKYSNIETNYERNSQF